MEAPLSSWKARISLWHQWFRIIEWHGLIKHYIASNLWTRFTCQIQVWHKSQVVYPWGWYILSKWAPIPSLRLVPTPRIRNNTELSWNCCSEHDKTKIKVEKWKIRFSISKGESKTFVLTFALKQITFSLFNIVAITQLLIQLLSCCWFLLFHLIRIFNVRCRFNTRFVLLIRQTMTIALLNAFTWLWTRTPFTPTAPAWIQKWFFESENGILKEIRKVFLLFICLNQCFKISIEVLCKYLSVFLSFSSSIHSQVIHRYYGKRFPYNSFSRFFI